jgi:hypothetical protein
LARSVPLTTSGDRRRSPARSAARSRGWSLGL